MNESYGVIRGVEFAEVAFVLDSSESAVGCQDRIIALVRQVISELPARIKRSLYFLGDSNSYDVGRFDRQVSLWFNNRKRVSLITPVYKVLAEKGNLKIAIIGSGKIYDIDDWQDSSLLKHTLLVSMDKTLQGDPPEFKEIMNPTPYNVCSFLHDPVKSIKVSGTGFMPTFWSNSEYRLGLANGEASLTGTSLQDYNLTLRFFSSGEVCTTINYASGREEITHIQTIKQDEKHLCHEVSLTRQEADIFKKVINKENFKCICCGEEYTWDTLYCKCNAVILGNLIYPSLQNHKGFVLFSKRKVGVYYRLYPYDVLRLNLGVVAIREGNRAVVYHFDYSQEIWRENRTLATYEELGANEYAILI